MALHIHLPLPWLIVRLNSFLTHQIVLKTFVFNMGIWNELNLIFGF